MAARDRMPRGKKAMVPFSFVNGNPTREGGTAPDDVHAIFDRLCKEGIRKSSMTDYMQALEDATQATVRRAMRDCVKE